MKVLIYGGAFDPIHVGHLDMADKIQKKFGYDKVLFVPCAESRYGKEMAYWFTRNQMLLQAFTEYGNPTFQSSLAEIEYEIKGRSYVLMEYFKKLYAGSDIKFDLLIGSDTLEHIEDWYEFEKLNDEYVFIVAERHGHPVDKKILKRAFYVSLYEDFEISSTVVRHQLKKYGTSPLIPKGVGDFIKENCLYV